MPSFEQFLEKLNRMSPATACYHLELNSERYGKSVREAAADYRERFGIDLGN